MLPKKSIIKDDTTGLLLLILLIFIITALLILSIFIPDDTVSEKENRTLATFPKFSVSALFSGDFFSDFEEYFSDNFAFRNGFLTINEKIDKVLTQFSFGSGGENDVVVIDSNKERDMGGTSIEEAEGAKQ